MNVDQIVALIERDLNSEDVDWLARRLKDVWQRKFNEEMRQLCDELYGEKKAQNEKDAQSS